jgi:hypothetical protein
MLTLMADEDPELKPTQVLVKLAELWAATPSEDRTKFDVSPIGTTEASRTLQADFLYMFDDMASSRLWVSNPVLLCQDMAAADKAACAEAAKAAGTLGQKKRKAEDAPKAPRAKSAYMLFCADRRPAVKGDD